MNAATLKHTVISFGRSIQTFGLFCMVLLAITSKTQSAGGYDESLQGDFSNSGSAPTFITLSVGENEIFGTTGRNASGTDRDYFSFSVPPGYQLTQFILLPGTSTGATGFLGLEAGPQITLPVNASDATGLLGWVHYSDPNIGTDLITDLSTPSRGSSGFTPPLAAGTYSAWDQDTSLGAFSYKYKIVVQSVPDQGSALAELALASVATVWLRWRTRAREA